MYKSDPKIFEETAKQWVNTYAKEETHEDKIKKLMEMGFPEDVCRDALSKNDWNPDLALNLLLGL